MKSVLISVQPKWVEKIVNGEKTIEVRKNRPKLETPFKCYIYMTRGHAVYPVTINGYPYTCSNCGGMDVIGEFTCDRIDEYTYHDTYGYVLPCKDYKGMCLSATKIEEYGNGKTLYGWHISDLKIYDESKALKEFGLTRPFRSWGYVEEL